MVHLRGARQRIEAEDRNRMTLAWATAALTRAAKLPSLRSLLAGRDQKLRGRDALAAMRDHAAKLPKKSWEEWLKR